MHRYPHTVYILVNLAQLIPLTDLFYWPGSNSGKMAMTPVPLPPPQQPLMQHPPMHGNGSVVADSAHGTNQMLDYLESQVHGMDMASPLMQPQPYIVPPPPQHMPKNVPFSAGPPSMLSALDDGPVNRRPPPNGNRRPLETHYEERPRSRPAMNRSYSQEDMLGDRGRRSSPNERVGYRPRSRSRDDLLGADMRYSPPRQDRRYSPPTGRRGSWSSSNDYDARRGGARGGGGGYGGGSDKPPSYREYEPGQKPGRRPDRFSVRDRKY